MRKKKPSKLAHTGPTNKRKRCSAREKYFERNYDNTYAYRLESM